MTRVRGRGATAPVAPSRDRDKLITNCTRCRYGVFAGQPWQWTPNGIIHTHCPKEQP